MSLRKKAGAASRKYLGSKKTRALKKLLSIKAPGAEKQTSAHTQLNYGDNTVINHPRLDHAKITFAGKGNVLYCEDSLRVITESISFKGNNAVVYLSRHNNKSRKHRVKIQVYNDSVLYIGENTNFHPNPVSRSWIIVSEGKNVLIGDDCLFGINSWIRSSDGHAMYDSVSKERLNSSRSVLVGDHVWVGQDVTILKGSHIGSGSIIGARSTLTGKKYSSNSSVAGTPAKVLRHGVFFNKPETNSFTSEQIRNVQKYNTDKWIYSRDKSTLDFDTIDAALLKAKTSKAKLKYIQEHIAGERAKNRFYIGEENTPVKKSK